MGEDILGLPEAEARRRLAQSGLSVTEIVTAPPRRQVGSGVLRVVQQRQSTEGEVVLVVARFPLLAVVRA